MNPLYQREYSIQFDTTKITGLRVGFHVKKSLSKEPNTAEVKIYNLSENTRHKLQSKGTPFVLSGGYVGSSGVLFSGNSRTIDHDREGPDWITTIKSGDGEVAYQFKRLSKSYGPGTPIAQVINDAAAALSIDRGNLAAALAQPFRGSVTSFVHGYSAHGNAIDILHTLLTSAGFTMSIQNGALQVLRAGQPVQAQATLLSPSTGLIGSPEHAAPGEKKKAPRLKAVSLLQPQIICGGTVEIQSANVNGQFRVENLEHVGDSHGSQWVTKIEVKAP